MSTLPPTPHAQPRTKYAPTPRNPDIPATMRVQVEVGYVQSCPDCREIVANLAASCISDATVSGLRLTPGRKHAHEVTEGSQALAGLTDASGGQQAPFAAEHTAAEIAATAAALISDTNGSDPDDVDRALWATLHDAPNGLDPP